MTAHIIFSKIDKINTVTHSEMIKLIKNRFKDDNFDDLNEKSSQLKKIQLKRLAQVAICHCIAMEILKKWKL